jgi:hypothetical protein
VHAEFASHTDNWVFIAPVLAIAVGLLLTGPAWSDILWLAAGVLVFIPQEYFTHVHVLHARLPGSQRAYRWMYRLHYGHHDLPRRHDLMYMPLWLTLPMLAANVALLWMLTPHARAFWASFGGALIGYIVFEWSHLLCHVPFVPRNRIWRHVRTQHLLHHHASEKHGYAVAPWTLWMDHMLGTAAPREVTARSSSSRTLGLPAMHPWLAEERAFHARSSNGSRSASRLWLQAGAPMDKDAS